MATLYAPAITAFRSRAQLGLVAPRSVSHDIDANPGGVAVHYGGDPGPVTDHAGCEARWRDWQRMHMAAPRGWNDIAYTGGYCSHGYAFAGRGINTRTAGQGTNDGNQRYYAVCWVNDREQPTPEALAALAWWIQQLRAAGAGLDVRAHRLFHSTSCPGDALAAYAKLLDGKPLPTSPTSGGLTVDGVLGADTIRRWQTVLNTLGAKPHLTTDGKLGPATWTAVDNWLGVTPANGVPGSDTVRALQRELGVPTVSGLLGRDTVRALQRFLNAQPAKP
jgi:hypothetical protein